MVFTLGAINDQVIQVCGCNGAQSTNRAIHQALKCPWYSLETEWHGIKFEEPKRRRGGRLVMILTCHRYLPVPLCKVNCRHVLGSPNMVDDVVSAYGNG